MDNITKHIHKLAKKWKMTQIKKLEQTKTDMINRNIPIQQINEYIDTEYSEINKEYNKRLNADPSPKYMDNQKSKDINNIILTKEQLVKKGYATNFVNSYIDNEYSKLDNKYNKRVIDFID
jgi:hypothetical protein